MLCVSISVNVPVLSCLGSTIPLAHGLEGCSLALLVLILEEKYFKEHLITVQSAVLLKMPLGLMEGRSWMGEPCLCRDQAEPLWGHRAGLCKPQVWRAFGHGAATALGLGLCLGSWGVLCCCSKSRVCGLGLSLTLGKAQSSALCQMCLARSLPPTSLRGGCAAPGACSAAAGWSLCSLGQGVHNVPWNGHHLPACAAQLRVLCLCR